MNRTPRIAAIHDLSGFGRCSLTIVMPVLSAMGLQCCPLPTAYLSTHTGGFTGNTFLDMTEELGKAMAHWERLGLTFEAIYTGFMGNERQMALAADFIRAVRSPGTIVVVDPVMGDHGKLYRTYTPAMCQAMKGLAETADVIVPNATEAALLLDVPYESLSPTRDGFRRTVEALSRQGRRSVVLTGVSLSEGQTGAACFDRITGNTSFVQVPLSPALSTVPAISLPASSPAPWSKVHPSPMRRSRLRNLSAAAPPTPLPRTCRPGRASTLSRCWACSPP